MPALPPGLPVVRINRVYTRQGDAGDTRLAGGQVVRKSSARIEAYGTVDELNAVLAVAAALAEATPALAAVVSQLTRIQNELFDLGAQLAVLADDRRPDTPVITGADVERLEREIDAMNETLPPLKSFVLPGGGGVAAQLHVARTVCRRGERSVCRLAEAGERLDGIEIAYLNRLSDWLFVASRFTAQTLGRDEQLWNPGRR